MKILTGLLLLISINTLGQTTPYFDTLNVVVRWEDPYQDTVTKDNSSVYIRMYSAGPTTGDSRLELNRQTIKFFQYNQLQNDSSWDTTLTLNTGDIIKFSQDQNRGYVYIIDMTFTETFNVGIDENELVKLKVYPNPTKGILNTSTSGQYTIYNNIGYEMKSGIIENSIDVSDLPSGTYIISINGVVKRFVKY